MGIAQVHGCGIAVFLDRDVAYGKHVSNIVNDYLRCKDEGSPFYKKFHGYMRISEPIKIGERTYGLFSYQYHGALSAQQLATFLQAQRLMRHDPTRPASGDNIRVRVNLYPGEHPMSYIYPDEDIIAHHEQDVKITTWPAGKDRPEQWNFVYSLTPCQLWGDNSEGRSIEQTREQLLEKRREVVEVDGLTL